MFLRRCVASIHPLPVLVHTIDQRRGKLQAGTQLHFALRHLAIICLMIVACQVEHPVEKQNFELVVERMAVQACIFLRNFHADRNIASVFPRKRKDVSRAMLSAKPPVQLLHASRIGHKD